MELEVVRGKKLKQLFINYFKTNEQLYAYCMNILLYICFFPHFTVVK